MERVYICILILINDHLQMLQNYHGLVMVLLFCNHQLFDMKLKWL